MRQGSLFTHSCVLRGRGRLLSIKPSSNTLFKQLGGLATLEQVHQRFYDKVYAHPWLGQFFAGHDQQAIELRQTQFMAEKFGSETPYPGQPLELAHRRMFISETLLQLRQQLLRESLESEQIPEPLIARWLKIDHAFWRQLSNGSIESFQEIDLKYEQPMVIPHPRHAGNYSAPIENIP
ncbi:MAG: group 1 truncated hemoglobin [Mariprofundales bacterium]|nr:group 1 truncated hemoglobin [Mariprofundales bacterium]